MPGTLSIQGLLTFDPTLFDTMPLPDGLDRETVVGTVIYECAPFEVLIPQPELFKRLLVLFAHRRLPVWQKMYDSTVQRYEMLSDTETSKQYSGSDTDTRTPDLTRTRSPDLTRTRSPELTTEGQNTGSDSVEQQVAAFNSEDYANREKQTTTLGTKNVVHSSGTETETETGTDTETETGTEKTVRERGTAEHVTGRNRPAAELLKAEREAALFDVVHFIATDVKCNFCIMVY